MAFKIAPYPGQTYPGAYARHADIRAYLGVARLVERTLRYNDTTYTTIEDRKLPMDFTSSCTWVPLTDGRRTVLICRPGNPSITGKRGKSSAHRCFVSCPDCGEAVPAGRTHQHKCKGGAA